MEFLVIAFLLAGIIVFLKFTLFPLSGQPLEKNRISQGGSSRGVSKFCPLCGSQLGKGENVHSKVYPGKGGDRLMDVYGCPYCAPPEGEKDRTCPVCRRKVPVNGYIIGRYFVRPGKRHLHVLGCSCCRRG